MIHNQQCVIKPADRRNRPAAPAHDHQPKDTRCQRFTPPVIRHQRSRTDRLTRLPTEPAHRLHTVRMLPMILGTVLDQPQNRPAKRQQNRRRYQHPRHQTALAQFKYRDQERRHDRQQQHDRHCPCPSSVKPMVHRNHHRQPESHCSANTQHGDDHGQDPRNVRSQVKNQPAAQRHQPAHHHATGAPPVNRPTRQRPRQGRQQGGKNQIRQ